MDPLCDKVEGFADGRLELEDAKVFTEHLATCARCQAELTGLMQLEELGRQYVEQHGPVRVPWYTRPTARWSAIAVAAVAAVLLIVNIALQRSEAAMWEGSRTLLARVTYAPADAYRPPPPTQMSSTEADDETPRAPWLLGVVELLGEPHRIAALNLAAGRPDLAKARKVFEQAEKQRTRDHADLLCDLAAAYYAKGKHPEALALLDRALRERPKHRQALWNRALVYRELGLHLLAVRDFGAVKQIDPDPRWQDEATERQRQESNVLGQRDRWRDAAAAADALVRGEPGAVDKAMTFADVPLMRRDFYDAVRGRTTAAEVSALLPLARELDGKAKAGNVLGAYVQRVASRDFKRRAPLAERYARLVATRFPSGKDREDFLRDLSASGEDDLTIGALVWSADWTNHAGELDRLAAANPDPWFKLISNQIQAEQAAELEQHERARGLLTDALEICLQYELTYRCLVLENDLQHELTSLFLLDEATEQAERGLQKARSSAEWERVGVFLRALGNVARRRGDVTLGRAYYGEALLSIDPPGTQPDEQDVLQNLAQLDIRDLDLVAARDHLEQAVKAGPLTIHGAEVLVDLAHVKQLPHDAQVLEQALAAHPAKTAGERAYVKFLRGRFLVETDRDAGRALLESAIRDAEAAGALDMAKHARAYSYTSLIFDEAKHDDFESAVRRFGAELGFEVPARCVLALTEDTERSLILARGAGGRLLKVYAPDRKERLPEFDLTGVVPPELVAELGSCAMVDVLVRPPLQGRPGLLPPEIAWRYRSRGVPPPSPEGKGIHLVVNEVQYDRKDLKPLHWKASPDPGIEVRTIQGYQATPGRVSDELQSATEVDLATHGVTSPASNASRLVLAREVGGQDELREDRIRALHLRGAPLVILAACEAAKGAPELHELAGLPYAFLAAGAGTVIAAPTKIPDLDSSEFFAGVRARIRKGVSPAAAVRDERLKWIKQGKDAAWVRGILVFE